MIIMRIDDSWIEFHQVDGCTVEDTGEALILMKRRESGEGEDNRAIQEKDY